MCLGVPGQLLDLRTDELGIATGRVRFGGVVKDVCLAYVPEAKPGDYVLVHVGFALSRVDEDEARRAIAALREMGEAEGFAGGAPAPPRSPLP
jgi:hydrogenase expression/formation protein HypC